MNPRADFQTETTPLTSTATSRIVALAIFLCCGSPRLAWGQSTLTGGAPRARGVVHELRIYEIFDGNKSAFHNRFRDHAMRIMARYGFHIISTWETRSSGRTEFVYLLEWPDAATMKHRWEQFLDDSEWKQIKKETADAYGALVGDISDRILTLTDYSPRRSLLR